MAFKQLTNVKFLGVAGTKHCVSWSSDDKIAVVTQKGVHILDLCLSRNSSASELDFVRSLIVPHASTPTYNTGLPVDDIFLRAAREEVYEMMFDPLLFPGLKATEPQPPVTLQAVWSPPGMGDTLGSLLATRQSTGSVIIYKRSGGGWVEVLDISEMWVHHLKHKVWLSENIKGTDLYPVLTSRVRQVEATSLAWSQLVQDGSRCWALLFVAHRNSAIVVWRVEVSSGENSNLTASKMCELRMDMDRICHTAWHPSGTSKGILVVGDIKGLVKVIHLANLLEIDKSGLKAEEIWSERDLIAVTSSALVHRDDGVRTLAIYKGSCLVGFALAQDGKQLAKTIANLGTLDISGVETETDGSMTLVTQCRSVNKITLKYDPERKVLEMEYQLFPSNFDHSYSVQGLAASKNKLIYVAALTISAAHDHLVLREPTELCFFTYHSTFEGIWGQLRFLELDSVDGCWDYLELLRMLGHERRWNLDLNNLEQRIQRNPNLAWWLVVIKQLQNPDNNLELLHAAQERIETLLLSKRACQVLEAARTCDRELSAEELQSASLLQRWLRLWVASCSPLDRETVPAHLLLPLPGLDMDQPETCHICGAEVLFSDHKVARCEEGHVLPRCSRSLVACSTVPLRSCRTCASVSVQNPVFSVDTKCLICCRPMEQEDGML